MKQLKSAIDARGLVAPHDIQTCHISYAVQYTGHALLEMPTGTGKTVCLISLVTSYQVDPISFIRICPVSMVIYS